MIYACKLHLKIWRQEPLGCSDCRYIESYSHSELLNLLDQGYKYLKHFPEKRIIRSVCYKRKRKKDI